MTRAILMICVLGLAARTCGSDEAAEKKPAPVEVEPEKLDLSDPYKVAGLALEAYRDRDMKAYEALLAEPLAPGTKPGTVFKHELVDLDQIQGLYFLDEGKTIAAIIRTAEGERLAMWFRILRTDDGFKVQKLMITDETPPTDVPVEG